MASLKNYQVTTNTTSVPAHPHATWVAVYMALVLLSVGDWRLLVILVRRFLSTSEIHRFAIVGTPKMMPDSAMKIGGTEPIAQG